MVVLTNLITDTETKTKDVSGTLCFTLVWWDSIVSVVAFPKKKSANNNDPGAPGSVIWASETLKPVNL